MSNKKSPSRLWMYFTGIVFATIIGVFMVVMMIWHVMYRMGMLTDDPIQRRMPIMLFAAASLLLGAVLTIFVGKLIIHPIQNISNAFEELSRGNFDVRVSENERITEIREMTERFNAMAYDLSHIETLRTDFVANVSHEFKTPITAIEGYATLLQNKNLTPERHGRYVNKILDNSHRLTSLSGNVLMLSRLENQENISDKMEIRLDEQIRRCILMLENKWASRNIEFDMDLSRQIYYGSESLLEQVWINIIDNAVKYSPDGGCIHIMIEDRQDQTVVTIRDEGCGMSEEVRKHIFEKFYQGDTSHKMEGNGLGLALVKRIITLCRGEIQVDSTPDRGTSFTVSLPCRRKE